MDSVCLFPFVKIQDINCSSKIFLPSLGGSRWVLGIHGGASGSQALRAQVLLNNPFTSSQQWGQLQALGPWRPTRLVVSCWNGGEVGVGWAEDMDGRCLCVSCCLGSHLDAAKRTSEEEECSLGTMASAHHVRAQFTWISFSCLLALWSLLRATENEQIQYGRTECQYWGMIRWCGSIREGNLIHISVVSEGPFLGEQMARRRHEPE